MARNMNGQGYYKCLDKDCKRCVWIRSHYRFSRAVVYHKLATMAINNPYKIKHFEWAKIGPKTYVHLGAKS